MSTDAPQPQPISLWYVQETEIDPVNLEQIHALARKFDRRAYIVVMTSPLAMVAIAFLAGLAWQSTHDVMQRLTLALLLSGMLVSGYVASKLLFPRRDPMEPAVAYLRKRLATSLASRRRLVPMTLLPLLPGTSVGLYSNLGVDPAQLLPRLLPALLLLIALAFVLMKNRAGARPIADNLRALDELIDA